MLIQITNRCHMGCSHCMHCSEPEGQHMSIDHIKLAHDFAVRSNAHCIILTGGEPTEHPLFFEIVANFLDFPMVLVTTNGMWLDDDAKVKMMRRLCDRNSNLFLQVTNIAKYYPKRINADRLKQMFPKASLETNSLNLLALGRAAQDPELVRESESSLGTMSCFSSALVSAQLPYHLAIANMESRGKFCHPLVDYRGDIHWSESCLCPSFAHVSDAFDDICRKAHAWRPCLQCHDAEKLRNNTSVKYQLAKEILGIK